jgi:hypothetical protein
MMNGFIKRNVALLCLGGLTALSGCCGDGKLCHCYDNCWLTRYSFMATVTEQQTFSAQVNNGHVLDQTVYTYHFERGTDKLTKGGQEHLAYLARRRPEPDTHIYLQTAQDVEYDAAAPEQYTSTRADLDGKRVAAIQRFLNAETAGRSLTWQVAIHDAPAQSLPTQAIGIAVGRFYNNFQGAMPATSPGGMIGVSGGATSTPR